MFRKLIQKSSKIFYFVYKMLLGLKIFRLKYLFMVEYFSKLPTHIHIWMVPGKSAKIHFPSQSECNIGARKTVLTRMIAMKILYFHGQTGILTEPMRCQNLYISYGDTFMKHSKLCTMYLNLSAQKSLETRNQDKNHVYQTKYWELHYSNSNTMPWTSQVSP